MADDYLKVAHLTDAHVGFENRGSRRVPIHDERAITATLEFLRDFRPDRVVLGGDDLDLGPISHWNQTDLAAIEGGRLHADYEEFDRVLGQPLEQVVRKRRTPPAWHAGEILEPQGAGAVKRVRSLHPIVKLTGNHEDWVTQLLAKQPQLRGLIEPERVLRLKPRGWGVVAHGGQFNLGKLTYHHGDTIGARGKNMDEAAVLNFERNVRIGHFHTYKLTTKQSPVDATVTKTGVAVPCLCHRGPSYGKSAPNKWVTGFGYGYVFADGTFSDQVAVITNGRFVAEGRVYRG